MPTRFLKDALHMATTALPAQNTENNSNAFEIGEGVFDRMKLRVELPATPDLADSQTITLTLQDSANGVDFEAINVFEPIQVTGAGGTGAAAVTREFPLFDGVREYVRLNQAASATAGDNTAVETLFSIIH